MGAYYKEGLNPVKIYVEDKYIRAAHGYARFMVSKAASPTDSWV
ncbi:MAG: hypothetical protein AB1512_22575 [Thermodesulfobacteriota bacterium]